MGDKGKKPSTRGRKKTTTSVSIGGIVRAPDGKYGIKIRVGGKSILVPAGGADKPSVADIQRRIRGIGSDITATTTPLPGGQTKVRLKGNKGSISFTGKKP